MNRVHHGNPAALAYCSCIDCCLLGAFWVYASSFKSCILTTSDFIIIVSEKNLYFNLTFEPNSFFLNCIFNTRTIHPFSSAYPPQGLGGLEPIPAVIGWEAGYAWTGRQPVAGLTETQTVGSVETPVTLTPLTACLHAGEPGENLHRKVDSNPGPSSCAATVLTTAPPCCPYFVQPCM